MTTTAKWETHYNFWPLEDVEIISSDVFWSRLSSFAAFELEGYRQIRPRKVPWNSAGCADVKIFRLTNDNRHFGLAMGKRYVNDERGNLRGTEGMTFWFIGNEEEWAQLCREQAALFANDYS